MNLIDVAVSALIGAVFALITSYIKEWWQEGRRKKVSARLLKYDVQRIISNLTDTVERNEGIPGYQISILNDWREHFANVCVNVNKLAAERILDFYAAVQLITDLQQEEYNSSLVSAFMFRSKEVLNKPWGAIIKDLKKIC